MGGWLVNLPSIALYPDDVCRLLSAACVCVSETVDAGRGDGVDLSVSRAVSVGCLSSIPPGRRESDGLERRLLESESTPWFCLPQCLRIII